MFKACVFFCLIIIVVKGDDSVFEKIKSGFKYAGKVLGVDRVSGIAELVTEAFKTHKKGDSAGQNANIFSGFLRLLGFDAKKVGAIAVNALIFVAQLISSSLSRPLPQKVEQVRQGTPLEWVLNDTYVTTMLDDINSPELPDSIIEYIKSRSMDEETDCIQLLICKGAPFIWSMQKVVNGTVTPRKPMSHFPEISEVVKHADECEKKHPFCFVDYF